MIRNKEGGLNYFICSPLTKRRGKPRNMYLQFLYPLHFLFFPPSEPFFFCSSLYIPGRVEKTRYLCNQSGRLLSLGAESFSRFELIAGWNVIKVRIDVAPLEDAATSRKRKFLPVVLIRASLYLQRLPTSPLKIGRRNDLSSLFLTKSSLLFLLFFFFWEEKIIIRRCYHCYVCRRRRQSSSSEQSSRSLLHILSFN